ncbi:MAG: hypothetical protein DMG15_05960 [Acidobacteria bacterium]|nr:MAG: hypothetical protein DMG15_05960 [Acidobacteriota bacterium]
MAISRSQVVHLKCIMGLMRAFLVILLVAATLHAQTLADVARRERARRAQLKPAQIIKAEGVPTPTPAATKAEEGKNITTNCRNFVRRFSPCRTRKQPHNFKSTT